MFLKYIKNVSTLELNASSCRGCGMCVEVCPHGVFALSRNKAVVVDKDACMECGACMRNCPFEAIRVSAGVGCAAAMINGKLKGTSPDCGCCGTGCC
ncbi:MAG: mercury methylation ferredoxin HgcB [Syntrophorhabdaceae bacterium]|nr:mercury methylation ferredoxin HgcB [Syntrophorhabdaceae bacterium]